MRYNFGRPHQTLTKAAGTPTTPAMAAGSATSRGAPPRLQDHSTRPALLRRGIALEYLTLGWNVVGVPVLTVAALRAGSVAAGSFALDSAIEIGASRLVISQLLGTSRRSERQALRLLALAFVLTGVYVSVQASWVLATATHPDPSPLAIGWNAATCAAMLALAAGKHVVGTRLDHPVLLTESRVTLVDAYLAAAILVGLVLNAWAGWWWADPAASLVVVVYAIREAREAFTHGDSN